MSAYKTVGHDYHLWRMLSMLGTLCVFHKSKTVMKWNYAVEAPR